MINEEIHPITLKFDNLTIDKSNVFRVSFALWLLKTVVKERLLLIESDRLTFNKISLSLNSVLPWRRIMAEVMYRMAVMCPKTGKSHHLGEVTERYSCSKCELELNGFTWKPRANGHYKHTRTI